MYCENQNAYVSLHSAGQDAIKIVLVLLRVYTYTEGKPRESWQSELSMLLPVSLESGRLKQWPISG